MKTIRRLLVLVMMVLPILSWGEQLHPEVDRVVLMLESGDRATRYRGIGEAAKVRHPIIDEVLVGFLEIEDEESMEGSILIPPTWMSSLWVLVRAYPESGIDEEFLDLGREDAEKFQIWWEANREQVWNGDDRGDESNPTHGIPAASESQEEAGAGSESSDPSTREELDLGARQLPDHQVGQADGETFPWVGVGVVAAFAAVVASLWLRSLKRRPRQL